MRKNIGADGSGVNLNTVLVVGAAVGAYFFVLKPILEATGIKSTAEEEAAKKQATQLENTGIWDPVTTLSKKYPKGTIIQLLKGAEADQLAKNIYDSWGTFNDDEDQIYAQFNKIRYQSQVSSIVDAYRKQFNQDLQTRLKSGLSESEFNQIVTIISRKPSGISK